ncbi:MAG: Septum formation protein Maf [Olavius algarvensis Delta 4 endosymbiont]|nr:MAG: Septum formation protein Maf [Olavius algarvensis Delta 4 endosymbiont]
MENQKKLILASRSPRRRYLLEQAGLTFDVIPSTIDEAAVPICAPTEYARRLADAKAADIAAGHPDSWVLGADTIVVINKHILGKPDSGASARHMLRQLSGQTHEVMTGFAIHCPAAEHRYATTITTAVTFKSLSDGEIEWYVQTKEPFDKAGAYAIQGIGTFLVRRIQGSYTNVVGLPVYEVIEYLIEQGVVEV